MDSLVAEYPEDGISETEKNEIEKQAAKRATIRAKTDCWDLNIGVSLVLVFLTVLVLLFQGIGIEIVTPFTIFGLACVWLVGWYRQRKLYGIYYEEELINSVRESLVKAIKEDTVQKMIEETVEDNIQRALVERRDTVRTTRNN